MSDEEKRAIVEEVLSRVRSGSVSVEELDAVEVLDGVLSLPALKGKETVLVPIPLLRKPADLAADSANKAATEAKAAATRANAAAAKIPDQEARLSALETKDVVLSESEYEALDEKDDGKFYFIFEDE